MTSPSAKTQQELERSVAAAIKQAKIVTLADLRSSGTPLNKLSDEQRAVCKKYRKTHE